MVVRSSPEVVTVLRHIVATLPEQWATTPTGWPGQIELALLHAVLLTRGTHGGADTDVLTGVACYRNHRGGDTADDLQVLASTPPDILATVTGNQQLTVHVPKTAVTVHAAAALLRAGVRHARDVDPELRAHRAAYCGVHGLGPLSWQNLLTLLGHPAANADRVVGRFLNDALGQPLSGSSQQHLIAQAAQHLGVPPATLTHAIWAQRTHQG